VYYSEPSINIDNECHISANIGHKAEALLHHEGTLCACVAFILLEKPIDEEENVFQRE
jgi:hypothetical protein